MPGLVVDTCNPTCSGDRDQEDRGLKPALANKFSRPDLKNTELKNRTGGTAQVVEHLPSKCEAPSSNSRTTEINK
jgi:hypothetical protein